VVVSLNRIGGIFATLIFVYGGITHAATPLYAAAGIFLTAALISLIMPFEPANKRPV
jgi:hypothetical protein